MKCPICSQETTWQNNPTRPFCSEKCQTLDLGKWATEGYSISGNPLPELDRDSITNESSAYYQIPQEDVGKD